MKLLMMNHYLKIMGLFKKNIYLVGRQKVPEGQICGVFFCTGKVSCRAKQKWRLQNVVRW